MRNEERLREAVQILHDKADLHVTEHEQGNHFDWLFVRDVAAEALNATADGPQLDRLVEWLEEQIRRKRLSGRRYVLALMEVRDHIREMQP